jgi:hypothetical protein
MVLTTYNLSHSVFFIPTHAQLYMFPLNKNPGPSMRTSWIAVIACCVSRVPVWFINYADAVFLQAYTVSV